MKPETIEGLQNIKVLLISPPWYRFFGSGMDDIPLGLGYLASTLKKNKIFVDIYNADYSKSLFLSIDMMTKKFAEYLAIQNNQLHPIWKEIKSTITSLNPDIVGITATTGKFTSAMNVARICKEINPNIKIVVGGAHATCLPDEVINNEFVDFVVRGEGEETFLELVKILNGNSPKELKDCLGITYKIDKKIMRNPERPFIQNLNEIPFPIREFYINQKEKRKVSRDGVIFGTRGCPFNCIFCASHLIWSRKVRFRTPENVVAEIEELRNKYDIQHIIFEDDSFTLNYTFVMRICDLLIQKKLDVDWQCATRVNIINKPLLEKMKEAGCTKINLGVESGNEETLVKIKKGITKEQIENAFKIAKEVGMYTGAYLIIGFPWETEKHISDTIDFIDKIKPNTAMLSVATPYPSTELYEMSKSVLPEKINWEEFYQHSPNINLTKIDKEKFFKMVHEIETGIIEYNRKSQLQKTRNIRYMFKVLKRYKKNPKLLFELGISLIKKKED